MLEDRRGPFGTFVISLLAVRLPESILLQCRLLTPTMAGSRVSQWPPEITDKQREELTLRATTYALSHGLIYLPVADVQPPAPTSAIHAPLALFPSPFPRKQFELAQRLQRTYNVLYARIALDEEFLDRVMGAEIGVGRVDEFTGQLWKIWKRLRDQGIHQVRSLDARTRIGPE